MILEIYQILDTFINIENLLERINLRIILF